MLAGVAYLVDIQRQNDSCPFMEANEDRRVILLHATSRTFVRKFWFGSSAFNRGLGLGKRTIRRIAESCVFRDPIGNRIELQLKIEKNGTKLLHI